MPKGSSIAQRKVRVTLKRVTEEQMTRDTFIPLGMSNDFAIGRVQVFIEQGVFDNDKNWMQIEQEIEPIDVKDVE